MLTSDALAPLFFDAGDMPELGVENVLKLPIV